MAVPVRFRVTLVCSRPAGGDLFKSEKHNGLVIALTMTADVRVPAGDGAAAAALVAEEATNTARWRWDAVSVVPLEAGEGEPH